MHLETASLILFWISLAILAYTFVGYAVLAAVLARLFPRKNPPPPADFCPRVTFVMAVHNEAARLPARLENLLASEYPAEKLEIVVVSDASTDGTAAWLREQNHPRVRLVENPQRGGKSFCLNLGLREARGEVVVLGDVRQRFAADTIRRLVAHLADPAVGSVSGALEIEKAGSAVGGGVDAYWKLEKFIRRCEAQFDSAVGCTGAVYAIRRECYREIPADTLLDDVVIPMLIAGQGKRVLFDAAAVAYDPQTLEPGREKVRKQRTLAGNYQMLARYPAWMLPGGHRLWWQLISHKYLRLMAPLFMFTALISNGLLWNNWFYRLLFLGQILFYLAAMTGAFFPSARNKLFALPAGFVFLNAMSVQGLWHHLNGTYRQGSWPAAKR